MKSDGPRKDFFKRAEEISNGVKIVFLMPNRTEGAGKLDYVSVGEIVVTTEASPDGAARAAMIRGYGKAQPGETIASLVMEAMPDAIKEAIEEGELKKEKRETSKRTKERRTNKPMFKLVTKLDIFINLPGFHDF